MVTMTALPEILDPVRREDGSGLPDERGGGELDSPYVVILYNDDYHAMDEVAHQIQKATGYPTRRCIEIMFEAHRSGRAIAYRGSAPECDRVAAILRAIRLQVETDRSG